MKREMSRLAGGEAGQPVDGVYAMNSAIGFAEWIAAGLLWPGEWVCDRLRVADRDSRLLLRLFANLTIYSKLVLLLVVAGQAAL